MPVVIKHLFQKSMTLEFIYYNNRKPVGGTPAQFGQAQRTDFLSGAAGCDASRNKGPAVREFEPRRQQAENRLTYPLSFPRVKSLVLLV